MQTIDSGSQDSKKLNRRAFIVTGLQGAFLCVLGGRLAWLQVAQGQKYKTLADRNRINIKMTAPSRGQITDRFGVPLALNEKSFHVLVVPEQTKSVEESLRALQKQIKIDEKQIQKVIKEASKTARFLPVEVLDDLSWDDVAKIEVNLPDLPGLSIEEGQQRSYPFGNSTAHLVGYVGTVNSTEIKTDNVLRLPGMKIGKTGVEKQFEKQMRGESGASEVEVNVVGREVRELNNKPSRRGKRVVLSVDAELQRFTQERLEQERSASAVIMDIHTGAVYALASAPAFDPNIFTRGFSSAMWQELLADPGHPLTNKAVAGQYPPASTFKMITLLAALEEGKINGNTTVNCPGHYEYGGDKFHCWKTWGHGPVDLIGSLAKSCDIFYYKVATEIGIDKIAAMARRFGLGQKLDFELSEERAGLMPDKDWKMGYFGESWRPGETIVASIGQGYIQSTPLQLVTMTSRLVNGGYAVKPWMTASVGDMMSAGMKQDGKWPKIDIHPWHLKLIKRGMDRVVNHPDGTAKDSAIEQRDMRMGGKTGTSQVRRITRKQRAMGIKNEDLPWEQRHHALFVGYAPLNKPRYACCVVVEHGGGGSTAAAPIAKDIMMEAQKRNPAATTIYNEPE